VDSSGLVFSSYDLGTPNSGTRHLYCFLILLYIYWCPWIHGIVILYDFIFQIAFIVVSGVYLNLYVIRFGTNTSRTFEFFKIIFTSNLY
jgi:hypothetical protein